MSNQIWLVFGPEVYMPTISRWIAFFKEETFTGRFKWGEGGRVGQRRDEV